MRELLTGDVVRVLEVCGETGDAKDTNTYVVGGFVRDLLLRAPSLDIDVVVEGDGLEYADTLASRLGGDLKKYDAFGTATVNSHNGIRVDVASARREKYDAPAELPRVSVGNLRDDMFRRDFTINSMAISLNSKTHGDLVDFFSGERDISRKVIRVLHDGSFEDDPTRIMRAIRFETRFAFRIESKTEGLLNQALSSRMLERLTPERKRYELELLLSEEKPELGLERLRQLKVFRHLAPGLKSPEKRLIKEIGKAAEKLGRRLKPKIWLVYLISIADTLPFAEAVAFGKSISLKRGQIKKIIQMKMAKPEVRKLKTDKPMKASSVFRILDGLSPEVLVYLYSLERSESSREKFERYVMNHRGVRLQMTGKHLKKMGIAEGPVFKKVLDSVLDAKIDGEVNTLGEEMELASKIVEAS